MKGSFRRMKRNWRRMKLLQKTASLTLNSLLVFACFCLFAIESRGLFTCACATQILGAASIWEWRLFRSVHLKVRRPFKSSVWSSEYGNTKTTGHIGTFSIPNDYCIVRDITCVVFFRVAQEIRLESYWPQTRIGRSLVQHYGRIHGAQLRMTTKLTYLTIAYYIPNNRFTVIDSSFKCTNLAI